MMLMGSMCAWMLCVCVHVYACLCCVCAHIYIPGAGLVAVYSLNGSFLLYLDLNAAHAPGFLALLN